MRTNTRRPQDRLTRRRSRFGYDHRFWGEVPEADRVAPTYWGTTRRPLPCLAFIAPILIAYEAGVFWIGGQSAEVLRTGADAWLRRGLGMFGVTDQGFLPLGLVLAMVAWQAFSPRNWRFSPWSLLGMAAESLVLAVALVGVSRLLDVGFLALERHAAPPLDSSGGSSLAPLVGFLGAGIYEEALFRLALIPLLFWTLRILQTPRVLASAAAVTTSALLFSLAHHAGSPGETFTWFAFIFRWLAGVYFAWVFVVRGFGVAVGAHTAYDILVGWFGWHF